MTASLRRDRYPLSLVFCPEMSAQTAVNQSLSNVINNLDPFRPDIRGHWRTFAVKTDPQPVFPRTMMVNECPFPALALHLRHELRQYVGKDHRDDGHEEGQDDAVL